jgi:integrase/recombinase XerD
MSPLRQALADYLQLRRSLGYDLAEGHWLLPDLVAFLEARGATTVTVENALAWAQQSPGRGGYSVAPRRMTAARGFARHLAGLDPATEIPPLGLVPHRPRWRPPFLFTDAELHALLSQPARSLGSPLRRATYQALLSLLACTGLRIGEAIKLDRSDLDRHDGVLLIRQSKFHKSRLVPLHASSLHALQTFEHHRDRLQPDPVEPSLFTSVKGKRLHYAVVSQVFRQLVDDAGIGLEAPSPPRLHDLRHGFAIRTLIGWYRSGAEVQALLPALSTYLGHSEPAHTYWYLSASPELLALAAARHDSGWLAARS